MKFLYFCKSAYSIYYVSFSLDFLAIMKLVYMNYFDRCCSKSVLSQLREILVLIKMDSAYTQGVYTLVGNNLS